MKQIVLEFTDEQYQAIEEAFCHPIGFGYKEKVEVKKESKEESSKEKTKNNKAPFRRYADKKTEQVDNPETKEEFVKKKLMEYASNVIKSVNIDKAMQNL